MFALIASPFVSSHVYLPKSLEHRKLHNTLDIDGQLEKQGTGDGNGNGKREWEFVQKAAWAETLGTVGYRLHK